MSTLKDFTATKYSDFQGTASIDMQDHFFEQLKKHLEQSEEVVVGAGFEFGELRGECSLKTVTFYVLAADLEYGRTMDEVADRIPKTGAKVKRFRKSIPVNELGLFIKRFNCCGIYSKGLDIQDFDIL